MITAAEYLPIMTSMQLQDNDN